MDALLRCLQRDMGRRFRALVRLWRGSEKDAGDLLDEVALAALQGLERVRATSYVVFRAWCAETARNHLRSEHRERRRRARRLERLAAEEDEVREPEPEARSEVSGDLLVLPPSQRSAFVLREGLDLGWGTIGFVLSRRPGDAARQLHCRARRRLATSIGA